MRTFPKIYKAYLIIVLNRIMHEITSSINLYYVLITKVVETILESHFRSVRQFHVHKSWPIIFIIREFFRSVLHITYPDSRLKQCRVYAYHLLDKQLLHYFYDIQSKAFTKSSLLHLLTLLLHLLLLLLLRLSLSHSLILSSLMLTFSFSIHLPLHLISFLDFVRFHLLKMPSLNLKKKLSIFQPIQLQGVVHLNHVNYLSLPLGLFIGLPIRVV